MTEKEIIKHINDGANYYISLFGKAQHMEVVNKEFYSYIRPKAGEKGISIIYNVHADRLAPEKQRAIISEMKERHMPIWLDLTVSDEVFFQVFGSEKLHGQKVFDDNDDRYMALPAEKEAEDYSVVEKIVKVQSEQEFSVWAKIANDILAGGNPDMHPVYHYPLCRDGIMKCYIAYKNGLPAAVASIADNRKIMSLEFVATLPEMRRQGLAAAVCKRAVYEAFVDGAEIVTVRAADGIAANLYESLGFKAYNYAM